MKGTTILVAGLAAALAATACKKKEEPAVEPAPGSAAPGSAEGSEPAAGSGSAEGSAAATEAPGVTVVEEGFATPESVLYDSGRDNYIVSNINGKPSEADDNGYLVVVNPDGSSWKWIDGSKDDIKLDAPKGSAISGDTLWVADITVVRRFDAKAGAQQDDVKIEGATFLNDVVSDGAGGVFVTDSGLDAKFQPTGTDAVYHITKDGKVTTRAKGKELGGPNGVMTGDKGSVWVVTFGTGEIYELDAKGKKQNAQKLPKGQLDGVVALEGGDLLVSSWEGKAVYRGKPGGEWKEVVSGVESPADIAYDPKRKQIIIPRFTSNAVSMHPLE